MAATKGSALILIDIPTNPVTMRGDFMAIFFGVFRNGEVTLKGPGYSVERDGYVVLLEEVHDTPDGDSGTVVKLTFGSRVSLSGFDRQLAKSVYNLDKAVELYSQLRRIHAALFLRGLSHPLRYVHLLLHS